jgi:uncharacterized protein (DUF2267 family)
MHHTRGVTPTAHHGRASPVNDEQQHAAAQHPTSTGPDPSTNPEVKAMTTTHVDTIDRSAEKAHIWLKDLAAELGDDDRRYAYRVLRAFLHALRDRLTVDETAQLSAQLPIFFRGVFYEGWDPGRTPKHHRELDSFLSQIAERAELTGETEASFAASAAAKVLRHHVSVGEIESVLHVLPASVRELLGTNET